MITGQEVLVTINGQTASKRTRNRVRENGPRFLLCKESDDNARLLFKSVEKGWFGWLPKTEIKVHRLKADETTN